MLLGTFVIGVLAGPHTLTPLGGWGVLIFAVYFLLPGSYFAYGVQELFSEDSAVADKKRAWLRMLIYTVPWLIAAALVQSLFFIVTFLAFLLVSLAYAAPPLQARYRPYLDLIFGCYILLPGFVGYALTGGANFNWTLILAVAAWCMAQQLLASCTTIVSDERRKRLTTAVQLGSNSSMILALTLFVIGTYLLYPLLGTAPVLFMDIPRALLFGFIFTILSLVAVIVGNPYARSKNGLNPEERLKQLLTYLPFLNTLIGLSVAFWLLEKL